MPTGPCEVWRHRLGTPVSEDVLVLTETDERFELNLRASRSEAAILIWSESRDTSECWLVDALAPESAAPLDRRSPAGRRLPRRARPLAGRAGSPVAGDQRRRGRVPADGGADTGRRTPERLDVARGPPRGADGADRAGGRVRGVCGAQPADPGPASASDPSPRRPDRARARGGEPLPDGRRAHRAQHVVRRLRGDGRRPLVCRATGVVGRGARLGFGHRAAPGGRTRTRPRRATSARRCTSPPRTTPPYPRP